MTSDVYRRYIITVEHHLGVCLIEEILHSRSVIIVCRPVKRGHHCMLSLEVEIGTILRKDPDTCSTQNLRGWGTSCHCLCAQIASDAGQEQWRVALSVGLVDVEWDSLLLPFVDNPLHNCRVPEFCSLMKRRVAHVICCLKDLICFESILCILPKLVQDLWFLVASFRAQVHELKLKYLCLGRLFCTHLIDLIRNA